MRVTERDGDEILRERESVRERDEDEREIEGNWRDGREVYGLEASFNNSQVFGVTQYKVSLI